jgi:hypothetical protein
MSFKHSLIAVATTALISLALAGCGGPAEKSADDGDSTNIDTAATPDTPSVPETSMVTIDGSHIAKTYDGKDAIVVDYTFTNTTNEDSSFELALICKAFQQGIQLDGSYSFDDDSVFNSDLSFKDLKPGASLGVQKAYELSGDSNVSVECKEFLSFNDAIIASKEFAVK